MLETLRFVQGAVAEKDLVPVLTHFNIRDGHILGHNGRIALCSPIALDLEANPRAEDFARAIATCTGEVALTITPAGRLAVTSGAFKAFIDCTTEPYPSIVPTGQHVQPRGAFLDVLRKLLPFVAEDASRPWAMGILLHGSSAYATNNIVLVEHWLGFPFPVSVNLPKTTVQELLRIGQEPIGLQVDANSITFFYENDRWLHSVLYTTAWPDVTKILERQPNYTRVPEGLFKALHDVRPFAQKDGRVYVTRTGVGTSSDSSQGAHVALPLWEHDQLIFNVDQLLLLEDTAQWFDTTSHPHLWMGDGIRGAIAAMR